MNIESAVQQQPTEQANPAKAARPKKSKDWRAVNFRVSTSDYQRLQDMAVEQDRSLSWIVQAAIRQIIRDGLKVIPTRQNIEHGPREPRQRRPARAHAISLDPPSLRLNYSMPEPTTEEILEFRAANGLPDQITDRMVMAAMAVRP